MLLVDTNVMTSVTSEHLPQLNMVKCTQTHQYLGPMYARQTDRQTDAHHRLMSPRPLPRAGYNT